MMKNGWGIIGFGMIFLTEAFLSNASIGYCAGTNRMIYGSITDGFECPRNPFSASQKVVRGQEKKETTLPPPRNSKIELRQLPRQVIEDIKQIENSEIRYDEESADYYGFIKGSIPILISAPHGAKHFRRRENCWKGEDEYTSSLAIKLGQLTGAYVIYVKNKTREDPNNDPTSEYKTTVSRAVRNYNIKFLLDLHGSDEGRPFKVDIGIISEETKKSSCPTFKETIREVFSDFEGRIFNKKFSANDTCTVTFFARNELGIEAAQVEINGKYRIVERKPDSTKAQKGINPHFKANEKDVLDLLTRLERMIHEIDREIKACTVPGLDQFSPVKP
jgi:hypothetical protein